MPALRLGAKSARQKLKLKFDASKHDVKFEKLAKQPRQKPNLQQKASAQARKSYQAIKHDQAGKPINSLAPSPYKNVNLPLTP